MMDRRRYPRVPVDVKIRYRPFKASDKARDREEKMLTLSEGGCFIQAKLTYPPSTVLNLSFTIEGREFQMKGSVRYAIPFQHNAGDVQFPGMGIQFVEAGKEDIEFLRKFVAVERMKQGMDSADLTRNKSSKEKAS